MKERPNSKTVFEHEDDIFDNRHDTEYSEQTQDQFQHALIEMQEFEDEISFCQDIIERIKDLTEYHVLPIAERITLEHIESFLKEVKNS